MTNINIVKETKFKNIYISLRFLSPLKKENVLSRLVLANILNESCKKYPNKQAVTCVLDSMYGANYSANSSVIGKGQIMVCKCSIIHPSYIKEDNSLLEDTFKVLYEFIKNPLLVNHRFDKNVFLEAKRNLKDTILRSIDDPSTYCMYEAMRKAGKDQPLAWSVFGDVEDVECITMEEVVNSYYDLIKNAKVDVLVLGDVEERKIQALCKKYLKFNNVETEFDCHYVLAKKNDEIDFVKQKDLSQSYITMMYSTNIQNDTKEFNALKVANAILGQLPTSLLFQEVREKHSLCYSIYSSLFGYDGVLAISTGVEVGNEEKTITLIKQQVEKLQIGDFASSLIETAKKMLINSLRSTNDSPESIFGMIYRNIILHRNDSLDQMIKDIEEVTESDVINVMKKIELCTSYVLKGVDLNEESSQ